MSLSDLNQGPALGCQYFNSRASISKSLIMLKQNTTRAKNYGNYDYKPAKLGLETMGTKNEQNKDYEIEVLGLETALTRIINQLN